MAATRDLESSLEKQLELSCLFFLAMESGQTSSQPLHKEKFNVLISENDHKELRSFKHHLMQFMGLADIAVSKGVGKSFDMSIARVQKALSGVEAFSLRAQDAWKHKFPKLIDGSEMLSLSIICILIVGEPVCA